MLYNALWLSKLDAKPLLPINGRVENFVENFGRKWKKMENFC